MSAYLKSDWSSHLGCRELESSTWQAHLGMLATVSALSEECPICLYMGPEASEECSRLHVDVLCSNLPQCHVRKVSEECTGFLEHKGPREQYKHSHIAPLHSMLGIHVTRAVI